MFGDMGHGLVLFLVGIILTLFDGVIRTKMPAMSGLLTLRYLILLMGLFAFYCGIIYNDYMAIPVWLFGSCYDLHEDASHPTGPHQHPALKITYKEDCVYPFGIDPSWYLGKNELQFANSLKMKLSVILGVLQMALGVCMKAFNATYFNNKLDLICEFVP